MWPPPVLLVAASYTTCALRDGGSLLFCWGVGTYGSLGTGDTASRGEGPGDMGSRLPAVNLLLTETIQEVAVGGAVTCVTGSQGGGLKCVGLGALGQLGYGDLVNRGDSLDTVGERLPFVSFPGAPPGPVQSVAVGTSHTCVLFLGGTQLRCFGSNQYGELGLCDDGAFPSPVLNTNPAVPYVNISSFPGMPTSVHAGNGFTCLFANSTGVIVCWGRNNNGQLGRGHSTNIGTSSAHLGLNLAGIPVNLTAPATALSLGFHHACAILSVPPGSVTCWGSGDMGALGLGDSVPRGKQAWEMGINLPRVDLGLGRTALRIAAGGTHSCAILDTRQVLCWGRGEVLGAGSLGGQNRGDASNEMGDFAPLVDLGPGFLASEIGCGATHTCVEEYATARIRCFGDNTYGQLGLGDTMFRGDGPNEMGANLTITDVVRCRYGRFDDSVNGCMPCTEPLHWCGLGATRASHVDAGPYLSYQSVLNVTRLRGKRSVTWLVHNTSPDSREIQIAQPVSGFPPFVEAVALGSVFMDARGLAIAPNTTAEFRITISDVGLDRSKASLSDVIAFAWLADSVPMALTFNVSVAVTFATILVTPSAFTYEVSAGSPSTAAGDIFVFNTLCSAAVNYSVSLECEGHGATPSWLRLTSSASAGGGEPFTIAADEFDPQTVSFALDFSSSSALLDEVVDVVRGSKKLTACLAVVAHYGGHIPHLVTVVVEVLHKCPVGYFSVTGLNTGGCSPCPVNTFAATEGTTQCQPCPERLPLTLHEGSSSLAQCLAAPGFFQLGNHTISPCLKGANCSSRGVTLETLPLLPGRWRSGKSSQVVVKCPHPQLCVGGSFYTANGSELPSQTALCLPGHAGVLCESCQNTTAVKRGLNSTCVPCSHEDLERDRASAALILTALVVCLLLLVALVFNSMQVIMATSSASTTAMVGYGDDDDHKNVGRSSHLHKCLSRFDVTTKTRQLIGHFQILGASAIGFGEFLPDAFHVAYTVLALLGFNVLQLIDWGCGLPVATTHYTSVLVSALLPLGVLGGLYVAYAVVMVVVAGAEDRGQAHRDAFISTGLFIMFIVQPSVVSTILLTFACEPIDGGGTYLRADPSLSCDSREYTGMFGFSIVACLVYLCGVPGLFCWLLWRERHDLELDLVKREHLDGAASTSGAARIRFLWSPYRSGAFWFELCELARRSLQVAVVVLVPSREGPMSQLALLLVTLFFLIILHTYKPHRHVLDYHIAATAQWVIVMVSFLGMLQQLNVQYVDLSIAAAQAASISVAVSFSSSDAAQPPPFDSQALHGGLLACFCFVPVLVGVQLVVEVVGRSRRRR